MARVPVNPQILAWARETAGLTPEAAARKLGLRGARGLTVLERMHALESGAEQPTRAMLVKMATQYRRPLVTFYMDTPPRRGDRGQDFRRLPADYSEADDALVEALLRDIKARQGIVRAVLEDEEEAVSVPLVGSWALDGGAARGSEHLVRVLNFSLDAFRAEPNASVAFAYVRGLAEAAGIFVLLAGDLGSHHTRIPTEIFRGFTLADPVAPFIVINDGDARAAWPFTLVHELTHLCLGQTGISGELGESRVEKFCNDVAGNVLLPDAELSELRAATQADLPVAKEQIGAFAEARNVSRSMVAYKLYRAAMLDFATWDRLRQEFRREWLDLSARQREERRAEPGGPDYYRVRRHRVGRPLIELVSRMLTAGVLTSTKAAKVLGVKPRNVYELIQAG